MVDDRIQRPQNEENLEWSVIEPMWGSVDIYDSLEVLETYLAPASPGQRAVFSTTWLHNEVCNGGFDQFFYNSTGILSHEALLGFERLGATDYRGLVERAMSLFPEGIVPSDRAKRVELLESIECKLLEEIDRQFLALDNQAPLYGFMHKYISEHPEEFFIE